MSTKKKYSKPFGKLNSLKTSFFENNDGMLQMADGMADVLLMQPKRTVCKICGKPLSEPLYRSHRIGYAECPNCGHLNSECVDNDEFANHKFEEGITINHLKFNYSSDLGNVIDDLSLEIKKNESVAFIGESGAGKSTLADIILRILLLQPCCSLHPL